MPMPELDGRVALVTGGARNIGRAIAFELADAGAAVAVVARSDREGLDETAAEIKARGGQALAIVADLTDEAAVAQMTATTTAAFGKLDILVNNAAVRGEAPLEDMTAQEWRRVMSVTLDAPYLCCRAALAALKSSDSGTIVNIGGLTAYTGAPKRAHVVAAKAGLDGLTKALAHELSPHGITVNCVSPGLIATERGRNTPVSPEHHRRHATLLGRRGEPKEVAQMVRHLAGPAGRFITGQTIHVNGGAYLP